MVSLEDITLPPHNVEAEKWVIAGVLLDNELLYVYEWIGIEPRNFYKKEHDLIFTAIKSLRQSRKTVDAVTLGDELTKMGDLDNVWWSDYLFELSTFLVTTSWCPEYAKIVKEKWLLRDILKVCQKVSGEVYEQKKETLDIMEFIEKQIFDLTQITTGDKLEHIKEVLGKRIDEYMEILDNPSKIDENKVMSQYGRLDELLWWFKAGELIILAARPAMWKTAFALNLLVNTAIVQRKAAAFFSLEMTSSQLVDRLLSTVTTIPMYKISKGKLDTDDFSQMGEWIEKIGDSPVFLDDKWSANVAQLRSKLRRLIVEKWQIEMVIIDYLQLMEWSGAYMWNRVQEVSQISRWLKELAKELHVPIIALSQLSRGVEQRIDKKPQLSDLRESWSIEQDADVVMMLHREEYYDPDTDRKGSTDVLIRKNRQWMVGEVELKRNAEVMKFDEIIESGSDGTY